jgi:hypothetical protein
MEKEEILEGLNICNAASRGFWMTSEDGDCVYGPDDSKITVDINGDRINLVCVLDDNEYHTYFDKNLMQSNAKFIAYAREALPKALRELARLQNIDISGIK